MAVEINLTINELIIHIPNSEASVDAQHNGNKDTSVGSYYMSERQPLVIGFLNEFIGDYFIDIAICYQNAKKIYDELIKLNYENAFKYKLLPQKLALEKFQRMISEGNFLYEMPNPTVNENNKYLKFDNLNQLVATFRTLCLGELCDICIKKIGTNGYIVYLKKSNKYENILNGIIKKWIKNND